MADYALDPELDQEYGNGVVLAWDGPAREVLEFNMWRSVSSICAREGAGSWTVIPRMFEGGEGPWADRFEGYPYWYGVYRPTRLLDALLARLEANADV